MLHTVDYLVLKPVIVNPVTREQSKRIRNQIKHGTGRRLKEFCRLLLEWRGLNPSIINGFEKHHVIPVEYGGTSAKENLVYCEPKLHRNGIHYLIHELRDAREDGLSYILVHPMGEKIWAAKRPVEVRLHDELFCRLHF